MKPSPWNPWAALLSVGLLSGLAGCEGVVYVAHLVEGQLQITGDTEPIDAVLAADRLTADDADKLRLAAAARDYATGVMGLSGGSYETFYDAAGDPVAWNLSAARRDALVPYEWAFPIVGELPYVAFFDEAYLRRVEGDLQADGYDTFSYELDAYSTLGLFADPVRSTMLRRGRLSLSETIIHELLHNTIWRGADVTFNESLATFVGRQGAVDFLTAEFGAESGWPATAVAFYADLDAVNAFLLEFFDELAAFYAQPLSSDELIARREAVFAAARARFVDEVLPTLNYPDSFGGYAELPTNNAWVLGNYRYNLRLDVFAAVYQVVAGDWPAALEIYRAAANAPGDPYVFLQQRVAELTTSTP